MIKGLSRRNFLRGTAFGAPIVLGLPLFDHLLNDSGTAFADGHELPRRFGIFFWGNGRGTEAHRWTPAQTGANWTVSEELAPLQAYKQSINVISGMRVALSDSPQGHHKGSAGILSGLEFIAQEPGSSGPYRSTFSGPSIDQVIAAQIGATTPFKSMEIGISERLIRGEGTTIQFLSHNGPDNTNPPEYDPAALYDRIFQVPSVPVGDPGLAAAAAAMKASVLDNVTSELSALHKKVGTRDRARLEQHLTNIREIEQRLSGTVGSTITCETPTNPGQVPDHPDGEPLVARMKAMSDLIALALACDVSRVFTVHFSGSAANPVFHEVDVFEGNHVLSHEGDAAQDEMVRSTIFAMEQFNVLVGALDSVSEGDHSLLHQSAVMASSDTSDGALHSVNDYPLLVAGAGGGFLKSPGVHYASDGENTSKVLLSLVRAMNIPATEFGGGGGYVTESCTAIEA